MVREGTKKAKNKENTEGGTRCYHTRMFFLDWCNFTFYKVKIRKQHGRCKLIDWLIEQTFYWLYNITIRCIFQYGLHMSQWVLFSYDSSFVFIYCRLETLSQTLGITLTCYSRPCWGADPTVWPWCTPPHCPGGDPSWRARWTCCSAACWCNTCSKKKSILATYSLLCLGI